MSKSEVTAAELDRIFGTPSPAPCPTHVGAVPVTRPPDPPAPVMPTATAEASSPTQAATEAPNPLLDNIPDLLHVVAADTAVQEAVAAAVRAFLAGGGRRG